MVLPVGWAVVRKNGTLIANVGGLVEVVKVKDPAPPFRAAAKQVAA